MTRRLYGDTDSLCRLSVTSRCLCRSIASSPTPSKVGRRLSADASWFRSGGSNSRASWLRCTTTLQPMTMVRRPTFVPSCAALDQEPVLSEHLLQLGTVDCRILSRSAGRSSAHHASAGRGGAARDSLLDYAAAARQRWRRRSSERLNRIRSNKPNTRCWRFWPSMVGRAQPPCERKPPPAPPCCTD